MICFFITTMFLLVPEIWSSRKQLKKRLKSESVTSEQYVTGNVYVSESRVNSITQINKNSEIDGELEDPVISFRNVNREMTHLGPIRKLALVFLLCQGFAYFRHCALLEKGTNFGSVEFANEDWKSQIPLAFPVILFAFMNFDIMCPIKANEFGLPEGDYKIVIAWSKFLLLVLYTTFPFLVCGTLGDNFPQIYLGAYTGTMTKYILAGLAVASLVNAVLLRVMVRCKVIQTALMDEKDTTRTTFFIISSVTIFSSMLVTTLAEEAMSLISVTGKNIEPFCTGFSTLKSIPASSSSPILKNNKQNKSSSNVFHTLLPPDIPCEI